MLVTLSGMVMEVRPLQPEKAQMPMEVTPSGIMVFLQPIINVFVAEFPLRIPFCKCKGKKKKSKV